ncbi:MAG: hypothetical protein GYA15_07805 [Leptolinea sp.]|jgi:hypothetical protein|nr:hypothetical protein [Leptolinea sp.]
MSRKVILIGLILVLALSSCSFFVGKKEEVKEPAAVEPTVAQPVQKVQPVEQAQPVQVSQQVEPMQPVEPAQPVEPVPAEPVAPPPTEPPAEPAPTEQPAAPAGYTFRDDFDIANDNFTEDFITTTQAVTRDRMQTQPSVVQDGILTFNIRDNETYIYKFVKGSNTVDSVIEAKWKSNGQSMNGVSLICRAAEDNSSWYEFRLSSQGEWNLLRYDKSIRDNDPYKNPYVTIKKGLAKLKLVRVSGDNVSKFTCAGSKLTYEVNGTKIAETSNNEIPGGGMVGLGSMSAVYLPVVIQWDYFSVTPPQ